MGRILFVSCTPVARYMIETVMRNKLNVDIVGIVNLRGEAAVNKANYDNYLDLSAKYNIETFFCNDINDAEVIAWVKEKQPDIIIQSGWSQKFANEILTLPKYGCIGEHPAPLPKGRGAACVNWAILQGETMWGDSFFRMVEKYDEGELFAQEFFTIEQYDDVCTVYSKVAGSSSKIILDNIENWSNGLFSPKFQDDSKAAYYKRRKPQDGYFSFETMTGVDLHNHIRAQTRPYPGAFFLHNDNQVYVWKAVLTQERSGGSRTFLGATDDGGLLVKCMDGGVIKLLRVQTEGTPEQWAGEWAMDEGVL